MMKATYSLATTLALAPTAMAQFTWGDPKHCEISGDPHFYPFGTSDHYDNMDLGSFNYVYGLDGNLVIQGRQDKCLRPGASCLESVAVLFCGTRLEFSGGHWKNLGVDSNMTVALPEGFNISDGGWRVTILTLPDGTNIRVAQHGKTLSLWIHLEDIYDNNVKGMCGVHDSDHHPILATSDIDGDAHHVYADGNRVIKEANIADSENGVSLPTLEGYMSNHPYICPADEVTGEEVVEGTSDDTGPLIEGTTKPQEYSDDEMEAALTHCKDAAEDYMEDHESCNVLVESLDSYVKACQLDALEISFDEAKAILLDNIHAACEPRSNCHLRRY